jgi:hypothetical protein
MAVAATVDPRTHFLTGTPREFFDRLRFKFDLIWMATVLGGIRGPELLKLADDLASALASRGLLFFAENTAPENPENNFWQSRPEAWYEKLFGERGVPIERVGSYLSCGNQVSIFAGRKSS